MVSSTRLGSIRIIRTSSGVARVRIEVISPFRQTDLPAPVVAGDQHVRHLGQVGHQHVTLDVLAEADHHRVVVAQSATWDLSTSPRLTTSLSVFGISTPIADLPGIGEMIRTSAVFTA